MEEKKTPSRGQINKIYTENAKKQEAELREEQRKPQQNKVQEKTK